MDEIPYFWIIIFFMIFVYLFEFYVDWRQLTQLRKKSDCPEEIKTLVSDEKFEKSRQYASAKLQFEMLHGFIDTYISLFFF